MTNRPSPPVSWSRIARRIRVPLGFVFAALYVYLARPTPLSMLLGVCIILPGLALRAASSGHVRKNETLATSGPYAHTRNPLYLGSILIAIGFAVAARNWWIGIVIVVFFLAIYLPVIRDEERFLTERFPEFVEYMRGVPRLIPRLTPFSKQNVAFSWDLYRKHREYNAALGALAIMAVLVGKLWWTHR